MNDIRKKQVVGYKTSECQTNIWDSHTLDMCVYTCIKAALIFKAALHHISSKIRFVHAFTCFPCIIYQESTTIPVNDRR